MLDMSAYLLGRNPALRNSVFPEEKSRTSGDPERNTTKASPLAKGVKACDELRSIQDACKQFFLANYQARCSLPNFASAESNLGAPSIASIGGFFLQGLKQMESWHLVQRAKL